MQVATCFPDMREELVTNWLAKTPTLLDRIKSRYFSRWCFLQCVTFLPQVSFLKRKINDSYNFILEEMFLFVRRHRVSDNAKCITWSSMAKCPKQRWRTSWPCDRRKIPFYFVICDSVCLTHSKRKYLKIDEGIAFACVKCIWRHYVFHKQTN